MFSRPTAGPPGFCTQQLLREASGGQVSVGIACFGQNSKKASSGGYFSLFLLLTALVPCVGLNWFWAAEAGDKSEADKSWSCQRNKNLQNLSAGGAQIQISNVFAICFGQPVRFQRGFLFGLSNVVCYGIKRGRSRPAAFRAPGAGRQMRWWYPLVPRELQTAEGCFSLGDSMELFCAENVFFRGG